MNITLSVDKELLEQARHYAAEQGTTLNNLVREYLRRVARVSDVEKSASEFESLAREKGGKSESGFVFDREAVHQRREDVL